MFDLDLIDSMFDFKFRLNRIHDTSVVKKTIRLRLRLELESLAPPPPPSFFVFWGGVGWFF